ncbi:hypothetical protein PV516_18570 [Streptomyces scabiei]|uniref:hypothetical protein n=1 Tax=Streptomyces scabiei TaxID=1930 RepID=UPI0029AC95BC|nr:hypothetical protein [Streptomyces scabiei]MDX3165790.1 hypothetical protein [Streptomyces scabiei]
MSKLTLVELTDLPRKPQGCPPEVERSWARLVAAHKSVAGLFTTLNELRTAQNDPRGPISEVHRDQARAAIVFTAAGIDACLRTLLRDSLHTLLSTTGDAHGAFVKHFMDNRLTGEMTNPTKKAIVDIDPRAALIDLYVGDLAGSSIQGATDLTRCRNALGLKKDPALTDAILTGHQPFFNARHEVVHELDLVDPSGKGSRGRRHRDIAAVGVQCDGALQLMHSFIAPSARAVKAARRAMGWSTP